MVLQIYCVSDGPPSLACRMALKYLHVPHEVINIDYAKGEFLTEEYAKKNPQKEIPVIDDNGFYLSESVAILQYLAEKYAIDNTFYPKDVKERAIVNHRLAFHLASYYRAISEHLAPIFFDIERTPLSTKKLTMAVSVFNTILLREDMPYSAGNHLTIADLALISGTLCLEATEFNLEGFPAITKWYDNFKGKHSDLWSVAEAGMIELKEFNKNPPKLPDLHHPLYPTRK